MHLCLGTTPTVQQTMIFDHVHVNEVNRAKSVLRGASGKAVNVARVLHTLGKPSTLCAPLGGDTGTFIKANLSAAGVSHACIEVRSPTRTCVTIIDQSLHTATELVEEHGPISATEYEHLLSLASSLIPAAKILVLSGSLAPGVPDDFYALCCKRAADINVPIILDARESPLNLALKHSPLIVKPNRAELAATVGEAIFDDRSLKQAILSLHDRGAQWVVVTMGREGAVASNRNQIWKIPAPQINVLSPIGSGDSFAAGLAAGITRGQEVPEACRLGAACAAANCLTEGSGILKRQDVHDLLKTIRLETY
ncbi:MAG: 1-phosphofructokinase family hexose kinase [Planctomycetota bacterium]|nr:1-phosphofructokinase family hexose kinase [Planctomycetota bacterium]